MRSRLTYANVVATLALVAVVAGGTAAALPGKKTVQGNDLKKNSVRAIAIAANAVRSAEIRDGGVGSAEVADQGLQYSDLGSNSVIARIRSTQEVSTAGTSEASPVVVPLAPSTWTQAPTETDVLFGEITFSQAAACTNGNLVGDLYVDGAPLTRDTYDEQAPASNVSALFADFRPWLFERGSPQTHTAEVRVFDDCDNANEDFTVHSVKLNVVGTR